MTSGFRACPDTSFSKKIYVAQLPKVDLGPDRTLCLDGSLLLLRNLQTLPNGNHRYFWNTGDTTELLQVRQPGSYSLSISSLSPGCTATATVTIDKDCYTNNPNAFTPNGDGVNDYFYPRQKLAASIVSLHLKVLNRWGQLVFETNKTDGRGWDGRFNGKEQPGGVYVYVLEVVFPDHRQETYQGNVTLIR